MGSFPKTSIDQLLVYVFVKLRCANVCGARRSPVGSSREKKIVEENYSTPKAVIYREKC